MLSPETEGKAGAMADHQHDWQIFIENREAVIEPLKRGECDGILPAARGFLDGFAEFLLRAGVLEAFVQFPDCRQRRSIPIFFFCFDYCRLLGKGDVHKLDGDHNGLACESPP